MSPVPRVGSEGDFQNKTPNHGDDGADHRSLAELPFRYSRADIGPGESGLEAQVAPQAGTGVKVVFGTGVPVGRCVGNDFGIPVMALHQVVGIEADAADEVAVGTGTRNDGSGAVRAAGKTKRTGIEHAQEAEVNVPDTSGAGVLSADYPWSIHPRSKDRRYRGSHKLALHYMVPCMNSYGMCVVDNFLGSKIGERILHEVQELHRSGMMHDGKLASRRLGDTRSIRGDQIAWVEGKEPGCENIGYLLSKMDRLVTCADGKLGKHKVRGRHSKVSRVVSLVHKQDWFIRTPPLSVNPA